MIKTQKKIVSFQGEKKFEEYIRILIDKHITENRKEIYSLLYSKDVDIIICKDKPVPKLFFIEIKYHKKQNGRLGFGHKDGNGFQPQILKKIPKYYENNLRWILASDIGNGIYFLKYSELKKYISGEKIGHKYNNFQTKLFQKEGLSENEFIRELKNWLE